MLPHVLLRVLRPFFEAFCCCHECLLGVGSEFVDECFEFGGVGVAHTNNVCEGQTEVTKTVGGLEHGVQGGAQDLQVGVEVGVSGCDFEQGEQKQGRWGEVAGQQMCRCRRG